MPPGKTVAKISPQLPQCKHGIALYHLQYQISSSAKQMDAVSELHLNQNATTLVVKVFYLNES